MKEFKSIYIENFENKINELIQRPNDLFLSLEKYGKLNKIPFLSVASGQMLNYIIKSENPNSILELGTGIGYSTIWMIEAKKNLKITSIDRNEKEILQAENFLKANYLQSELKFLNLDIIQFLEKENLSQFDFVFIDSDKLDYPKIFEILKLKCKSGTILVFDNMIWHGRIFLDDSTKPSDLGIREIWTDIRKNFKYEFFSQGDGLVKIILN